MIPHQLIRRFEMKNLNPFPTLKVDLQKPMTELRNYFQHHATYSVSSLMLAKHTLNNLVQSNGKKSLEIYLASLHEAWSPK
jgi:hypothetical protein